MANELFRRAGGHHASTIVAALGSEIDDPVGGFDHVEVVLDDHDRVALIHELVQHVEQTLDVGEVQPGGRLVEDVQGASRRSTRQFGHKLHSLSFSRSEEHTSELQSLAYLVCRLLLEKK